MKTVVSGVRLPPEWLPTSSTGPSSGTLPSPRTSPRNHSETAATGAGASRGCSRGRARRGRRRDAAGDGARRRRTRRSRSAARAARVAVAVAGRRRGHRDPPYPFTRLAGRCAPAERVDAREEPLEQAVRALRALDLRHVAAALEHDLLGARQPALDVVAEALRDQPVVRGPHEQRRRLQRRRAADRSRCARTAPRGRSRGRWRGTRAGRRASGRCARTRRRRCRPRSGRRGRGRRTAPRTCARSRSRPSECGQHAELGAGEAHEPVPVAAHERHGGAQQRDPADAVRALEADLDRHPAAHRLPTRWARSMPSASIVPTTALGGVRRAVGRRGGLGGAAEARQVDRVDACSGG